MAELQTPANLRTTLIALAVLAGVIGVAMYLTRSNAPKPTPPAPTPTHLETTDASPATPGVVAKPQPQPELEPAQPHVGIMPLDGPTLEQFQEANSRITTQLTTEHQGASYAVAASLAARRAIAELGHDPNRTVQYWLSARFADDVAAGDPAAALSTRRTVDNLLSVILGDTAGPEDFEHILSGLSPEVRSLATQRRAHR